MSRTFLITGVSSGLGRAFAVEALQAGHRVVGTVRDADQVAAFNELAPGQSSAMLLDVTDVTDDTAALALVDAVERDMAATPCT